jgi:putative colanic acid biosynthesis glycosyltransferase
MSADKNLPQIEIITVCKNNANGLKKTIESLQSQTHEQWSAIIVVGQSADNSLETAMNFANKDFRIRSISEPGNGIYPAMNLGLKNSKMKYVWFLNSGDYFASPLILEKAARRMINEDFAILLGGYGVLEGNGRIRHFKKRGKKLSTRDISLNRRGACHQSVLFNFEFTGVPNRFEEKFKLASDFMLILEFVSTGEALRDSEIFSIIEADGVSSSQIYEVLKEKQLVRQAFFGARSLDSLLGVLWTLLVKLRIQIRGIND